MGLQLLHRFLQGVGELRDVALTRRQHVHDVQFARRITKGELVGAIAGAVVPVAVLGTGGVGLLSDAVAIGAGQYHTCAVRSDGSAVCWGRNDDGQLGDGGLLGSDVPVEVLAVGGVGGLSGLRSGTGVISGGDRHTCAVTDAGGALCWGFGTDGRLGDGNLLSSPAPVDVAGGFGDLVQVSASWSGHACALRSGGGVACWGLAGQGQLGDATLADHPTPFAVDFASSAVAAGDGGLDSPVIQVIAGDGRSMAVHADGTLSSWGHGNRGRRGIGNTSNDATPRAASPAL